MGSKNSICYSSKQTENHYTENEIISTYTSNFNELQESFNCMVCLVKIMSFTPSCGHMGLCEECNEFNKKTSYRSKCMICKKRVYYNKIILPFTHDVIDRKKFIITENEDNTYIKNNFNNISKNIIEDFKKEAIILNNDINNLEKEKNNKLIEVKKSRNEYNDYLSKNRSLIYKNNNLYGKVKALEEKLNEIEYNIKESLYYNEELKKENKNLKKENDVEYDIQESLCYYEELKKYNDELKKDNDKLKQDNDKYFIENYIFKEDNKLLKVNSDINIYDLENSNISEDLIYIKSLNGKSENLESISE
tara:strand:+ start:3726 stop:4643 length:918 start_codon:yes stop_codon:yes gene_type:complete